jgi:signal transduction histidine kinase
MISFLITIDLLGTIKEIKWSNPAYIVPKLQGTILDLFADSGSGFLTQLIQARARRDFSLYEMPLSLKDFPARVILYSLPTNDDILIFGVEEEILAQGQLQQKIKDVINQLLPMVKGLVQDKDGLNTEPVRLQFEKIQSLNNELINTKRVLAKTNSTLEHRVQERTVELHAANLALQNALQIREQFIGAMSHELKTPMNAILGFTQLLLLDQKMDAENHKFLEIIKNSGDRLLSLINDTLTMSNINTGQVRSNLGSLNLHSLIIDTNNKYQTRAKAKDLLLKVELDQDLPEFIISDEEKIKAILDNLLDNAVEFTKTGSVTLCFRKDKDLKSSGAQEMLLLIDVQDTGVGIAPEHLSRLFNAYEQTQEGVKTSNGTGFTGLGLAISQSHAKLLGGDITITSTPGIGSCFHVKLAVQQSEKVELESDLPRRQVIGIKPGTKEIRVLIADDLEENRVVLRELLEPLGILTQSAENGKIALETAITWKPDLILMDSTARDKVESDTTAMTPESMTVIPQEIIDQMEVATTNARFEELVALIDKVSAFSPQMASKLRNLANDYQYDFLLKLFKKGEEDGD